MDISVESLEPELAALVGTELNDIQIIRPIGIGGMGVVFEGHQAGLNRTVAVKIANPSLGPADSSRFLQEAKAAARLDHPNCITVYEFGIQKNVRFMVMPLLRGRPLNQVLSEKISIKRALAMGLQIFRGLEHAHARDVIHRDLKPENVFVVEEGGTELLKIVDFGIAKIMRTDGMQSTATMSGLMSGTPEYMSPEQALGLPTDQRSDIYSAGIILYRLLIGSLPFIDDDPIVQLRRHITDEVPALPAPIPNPIARAVGRMVRKERDERYSSATEALADLEALGDGAHVLPGDSVPGPPAYASLENGAVAEAMGSAPASLSSPRRSVVQLDGADSATFAADDFDDVLPARNRGALFAGLAAAGLAAALIVGYAFSDSDPQTGQAGDAMESTAAAAVPGSSAPANVTLRKLRAVNTTDPAEQLRYVQRHELLDELKLDPTVSSLIDDELNLGLDLLQAAQSPLPCTTFRVAWDAIHREGPELFGPVLSRAVAPKPGQDARAGEPPDGSCEGLGERVEVARLSDPPAAADQAEDGVPEGSVAENADAPAATQTKTSKQTNKKPSKKPSKKRRASSGTRGARPRAADSKSSAARPSKQGSESKRPEPAPWERKSGAGEVKNPYD